MSLLKSIFKKKPHMVPEKQVNFRYIVQQFHTPVVFEDIIGYHDIKKIMKNMLSSEHPISILLDGSAGCGKSMFLKNVERFHSENSVYIDGSKATKAGIFGILFNDIENKIKYLIVDEIDKLNSNDQEALLTLIEDGRIIQTQKNGTMEKSYDNLSVIAASNVKDDILEPLLTRFYKIKIKDYSEAQFKEIGFRVLPRYNLSHRVIEHIVESVWRQESPNIRTCKQLAKLCNNDLSMVDLLLENST